MADLVEDEKSGVFTKKKGYFEHKTTIDYWVTSGTFCPREEMISFGRDFSNKGSFIQLTFPSSLIGYDEEVWLISSRRGDDTDPVPKSMS